MPGAADPFDRPRWGDHVLSQEASGTSFLLDVEDGSYFELNEVGASVWALCDGTRSVAEISACIETEYEAPPGAVAEDVAELVADLAASGLITTGP